MQHGRFSVEARSDEAGRGNGGGGGVAGDALGGLLLDQRPAHAERCVSSISRPEARGTAGAGVRQQDNNLAALLEFLAERLVHVYGESPNVDFVLALKRHAKQLWAESRKR